MSYRDLSFLSKGMIISKILKRNLLTFLLILFCLGVNGSSSLASKLQIGMFKNTKTCVVFEDGISVYNASVRDAVQKYWKSTNYEFIDQTEFEKRKSDSKYSFIVLTDVANGKDTGGVRYSYISLLLGDASGELKKMPEYCSIPLSYSGDSIPEYEYAMSAIIKFIQIHLKNLEQDRFPILLKGLKFYNKKSFKDKTLLLNAEKTAPDADSPEKIRKVYPFAVKLLTIAEIQAELAAKPENSLFLFHVGPARNSGTGKCFEMIFDLEGNLYYYNARKITNDNREGFNLNDFKELNKQKAKG
jgi:hypothetical protein